MKVYTIPRMRVFLDRYGNALIKAGEATGLILMIFFIVIFFSKFGIKSILLSTGIYFIYQEVIDDIKGLFRNFKR